MPVESALVIDYATRTIWALLVVVAALLVARAVRRATMRMLARGRAQANVTILLGNLAQVLVIVLGILGVLAIYTRDAFGWILTSFSVIGLVVGLSLQDILKNFFAGVWVLVERPFRIGDTISVMGESGTVEEIAFRTTMLKTADGREVIVPNAVFMTSAVTNITRFPTRRATVWRITRVLSDSRMAREDFDLVTNYAGEIAGYVTPPKSRQREELAKVPSVAPEPKPTVELRSVSEGKAHYLVAFWAADRDAAASAAISVLRAQFPQGEVHGA